MFSGIFNSKKVIVTGAGRGIGRELCKKLHEYGATVYAISKTHSNLLSLKKECPGIEIVTVNLNDWDATREAIGKIGPVDGLVNNAGCSGAESFMTITPETFDEVIRVNLRSVINVSQIVAQGMIDTKTEGAIVNMSSGVSLHPSPFVTSYSVSKAGLDMLTKNMAVELGRHKIRVNSVNPAVTTTNGVETDMAIECLTAGANAFGLPLETFKGLLAQRIPLGGGSVDVGDVVNTTLYLLSDMTHSMTGQIVSIDGGLSL